MDEAHHSVYAMHPGSTKIYRMLKGNYQWKGKKGDVSEFLSNCLTCQQVKVEHKHPTGLLQSLSIPEWKQEHITIDFVVGLPKIQLGCDAVWVIVDRLMKSAYFLLVKVNYNLNILAELYMKEIVRLHGAPLLIVSDRDLMQRKVIK